MGQVLVGAIIGALIGFALFSVPSFRSVRLGASTGSTIEVAAALHAISQIVGTAAGAIVGAIAGAMAARPDTKPLPRTFVYVLGIMSIVLAGYGVVYFFMAF